jgi:hypothetical protein
MARLGPNGLTALSRHDGFLLDMARDIATTDAYVISRRERNKVELFAHLKRILKLDRLRRRGPNGARGPAISLGGEI